VKAEEFHIRNFYTSATLSTQSVNIVLHRTEGTGLVIEVLFES